MSGLSSLRLAQKYGVTKSESTVNANKSTVSNDIGTRLMSLGMAEEDVRFVLNTLVVYPDGTSMPLFALGVDPRGPITWDIEALTAVMSDYNEMMNDKNLLLTGNPSKDKTIVETNLPVQEGTVSQRFQNHIIGLKYAKEKDLKNDTEIAHASIFKSPSLEEYNREELLKINLTNRKRIPLTTIQCSRCKGYEVYLREVYSRSGDEGAVPHYECGKCGKKW